MEASISRPRVAITGASGLIGSALSRHLEHHGYDLVHLVRHAPRTARDVEWDPHTGFVDTEKLEGVIGVVHLAGAGVGDKRWTEAYKQTILQSRMRGTRVLAEALARMQRPPRVLVSGSAIGFYGDTGEQAVDEASPRGSGFLADVVAMWEAAAQPAIDAGIRVAYARTGLVMTPRGGAMQRMLPLFKLGLGGPLGNGRQFWSSVSLADEIRALQFLLEHEVKGPFNITAPTPVTNREFTRIMSRVFRRPAIVPVPAFALRLVLGGFAGEVLGSQRVLPTRLLDAGFVFEHPDTESILRTLL